MDLVAQCVPDVQARFTYLLHTVGLYWLRFGSQTSQSAFEGKGE